MKNNLLKIIKDSSKIIGVVLIVCLIYRLNVINILLCMAAAVLLNISIQKENVKKKKYSDKFHDVILLFLSIIELICLSVSSFPNSLIE